MTVDVVEFGNHPPVLADVADQITQELLTLNFNIAATDIDGDSIILSSAVLPANATFTDNFDGTGSFSFSPDLTQAGDYSIEFYASDGTDSDTTAVNVSVLDDNQPPFVFDDGPRTIYEGDTLLYVVEGFDLDGTIPYLSATLSGVDTLARNMTFDGDPDRDGLGTLTFIPDYLQGGPSGSPVRYNVVFVATDEDYPDETATSPTVTISVIDRNFAPEINFPTYGDGPFLMNEGDTLSFDIAVQDVDWVTAPPTLRAENMPDSNAVLTFNDLLSRGHFTFIPDFVQAGSYLVRFIAEDDRGGADTAEVQIDVNDAGNQAPAFVYEPTDTLLVPVNHTYEIVVEAYDPELDSISLEAYPMLPGATWTNNGDGTWTYSFELDSLSLSSIYEIVFVATDYPALASDTLTVYSVGVAFLRGDIDQDNFYTVNDLASLINYLFRGAPGPTLEEIADVDKDGTSSVSDLAYLIYYMYRNGPPPQP
jgi:hypothetical protein